MDTKTSATSECKSIIKNPKLGISSIIEAKVGKLIEVKIAELLGA